MTTPNPKDWPLEYRKLADLIDHPKNPRIFTERGMNKLRKSLKRSGYIEKITIDQNNQILSGHARRKVLLELGYIEVQCHIPPAPLSEKDAEAILIEMNEAEAGGFSQQMLHDNFDQHDLEDYGMSASDFNKFPKKLADAIQDSKAKFILVEFATEKEQEDFYNEMTARKLKCKIIA